MYFSVHKRAMLRRILYCLCTFIVFTLCISRLDWFRSTIYDLDRYVPSMFFRPKLTDQHWNLFYHLGGNGPWIPRDSMHHEPTDPLPPGCNVDQVHMLSRHAERYPTLNAGRRHIALLARLQSLEVQLTGPLEFIKTWVYFTDGSSPKFEDLTTTGPYAGTKQAHDTGRKLRQRYNHLVNDNVTTNFWTCGSPRDIETAKYFATGFFGQDWERSGSARLHIIPEVPDRGADTLTPGDTCLNYINDTVYGHDLGYSKLAPWQDLFSQPIMKRLASYAGTLTFTPLEIYGMMEICGFEILVRGSSPWCDIFTKEEWLDFEYARDLLHFYRSGPGNKYAGAMGWLWLNATQEILSSQSTSGVYFSFAHDGDIIPLMATLGILNEDSQVQFLPTDHLVRDRNWKTSDVVPMGGRIIIERITCERTVVRQGTRKSYVRLSINDGLFDLDKGLTASGFPNSVTFEHWQEFVRKKGQEFGSFQQVCGLPDDAPAKITFLHQ